MSLFPESRSHEVPGVPAVYAVSLDACCYHRLQVNERRLPIISRLLGVIETREGGGVVSDVDEIQPSEIPSRIHSTFVFP